MHLTYCSVIIQLPK